METTEKLGLSLYGADSEDLERTAKEWRLAIAGADNSNFKKIDEWASGERARNHPTVETLADLDAIETKYESMIVYVKDEINAFIYDGFDWYQLLTAYDRNYLAQHSGDLWRHPAEDITDEPIIVGDTTGKTKIQNSGVTIGELKSEITSEIAELLPDAIVAYQGELAPTTDDQQGPLNYYRSDGIIGQNQWKKGWIWRFNYAYTGAELVGQSGVLPDVKEGDALIAIQDHPETALTSHSAVGNYFKVIGGNRYTHPNVTANDTTSTQTAAHGGTVRVIDSITRDSGGHVTGVNIKTVTLPSAPAESSGGTGTEQPSADLQERIAALEAQLNGIGFNIDENGNLTYGKVE